MYSTLPDCEKRPLHHETAPTHPPSSPRKAWKTLCIIVLTYLVWLHLYDATKPTPEAGTLYPGERIFWEPCGEINNRHVECGSVYVPIDQFNETSGDETFLLPLIRLRGRNATKNILLNPGGPGGSGINFMFRRGAQLNTIIGDGFHLVSFDPRGVNSSVPQAACYPNDDLREQHSSVRDADAVHDSPELFAWTHNFVRACSETMGKYGQYVNTPQTAADMNSILDALGQKDMYYWGFSYGTLLGQTYATLFPERSHRVIIDGVVNQEVWYEERIDHEDMVDTENVMNGFFKECMKESENCAMAPLADSWQDLRTKFLDFLAELKSQPLDVYVNSTTYGILDYQKIWYGALFPVLYKPQFWYGFADRIGKLMQGNATDAFLEYGDESTGEDESFYTVSLNDGASGPKFWPQDKKSLLELLTPHFNDSIFSQDDNRFYFAKQQWQIPKTHNFTHQNGVETKHPLLILSTTYDPVCPLVSAKGARAAFKGSRLVEVEGYGHCSVAVPSVCLAKHVRKFFYDGKLPENDTKCEVDGPYFFKPENGKAMLAQSLFEEPGDQEIFAAQLEMASDPHWPSTKRLRK